MNENTSPLQPGMQVHITLNAGKELQIIEGQFNGFINVGPMIYYWVCESKLDAMHHFLIGMPDVKQVYFTTPLVARNHLKLT